MKQIFIAFFLLLSLSAFAKNINLNPRIQTDGTALIENTKRNVQDRIHVQNTTNEAFEIVIIGIEKDGDEEVLCDTLLNAKEERYIPTTEDDDLDDFAQFRIELKNGAIEFCTAQCEWSDLHLVISKVRLTKPATTSNATEADELRKWKALLDDGIITQDEFNAKKKQLLGL